MRVATVLVEDQEKVVGVLEDGRLVDVAGVAELHSLAPGGLPVDMVQLIASADVGRELLYSVQQVAERKATELADAGLIWSPGDVIWRAPIPRPRQMPFVFANSPDSGVLSVERMNPASGGRWPRPLYFLKAPSSVIGSGGSIVLHEDMNLVTPEAELCIIVGKTAKRVRVEDAMDFVWGYSLVNDVTSGGMSQQDGVAFTARSGDKVEKFYSRPMARYKGADTFCPFGPSITLRDEMGPLEALEIEARYNGEVVERGGIADYKFSVEEVIATITELITLEPGDVVSMGTVPAVPGKTIRSANLLGGGTIELESPQIGLLSNPVTVLPPLWPEFPAGSAGDDRKKAESSGSRWDS